MTIAPKDLNELTSTHRSRIWSQPKPRELTEIFPLDTATRRIVPYPSLTTHQRGTVSVSNFNLKHEPRRRERVPGHRVTIQHHHNDLQTVIKGQPYSR